MDYAAWRFWIDLGQIGATGAIGVYVWWTNREKVTSARFATLEEEVRKRLPVEALERARAERDAKCTAHQARTAGVELELRAIPTRAELAGLSHDIATLTQQLGRLEGRLEGVGRAIDLVNEFLINQGGRS